MTKDELEREIVKIDDRLDDLIPGGTSNAICELRYLAHRIRKDHNYGKRAEEIDREIIQLAEQAKELNPNEYLNPYWTRTHYNQTVTANEGFMERENV